jgi:hypothetical protein
LIKFKFSIYLNFGFGDKADNHEEKNGDQVVDETTPVVNAESSHEGTHQHEENSSWTENSTTHQHALVEDVRKRNVVVDLNSALVVAQKIHDVSHSRGNPSATLVVKLIESFGTMSVGITGSRVFDSVASLEQ